VNPNDHSLWLARGRELLHLDAAGGLLQTLYHRRPLRALAFDRRRDALWAATATTLTAYDDTGSILRHLTPHDNPDIQALVYDPIADVLWVGYGAHRLHRYGAESGTLERRVTLWQPIEVLAPDYHAGLWITTGSTLVRLDHNGTILFRRTPFSRSWLTDLFRHFPFASSQLLTLVSSPVDGTAWVASDRHVRAVTVDEALQEPLAPDSVHIRALALYTDTEPPELNFVSPAPNSVLNTNRPSLILSAYDAGIGVDTDTLIVTANDSPLAV
jgi:ligand-binding sensor domain-containing protein